MLAKLVPRMSVNSIYDINLQELWNQGIRGIITDLDNTLVGAKDPHATPELINWLNMVQETGFRVIIVSNNRQARVAAFAEPLSVPYIHKAKKPTNVSFRKALDMMGLSPKEAVVIGDQMLTDVFGGNRMGLVTILVIPISLEDEGFFTKINRRLEKIFLSMMKLKRSREDSK